MTVNLDFRVTAGVIIDALGILCAQLTRDLFAIAKFLFSNLLMQPCCKSTDLGQWVSYEKKIVKIIATVILGLLH